MNTEQNINPEMVHGYRDVEVENQNTKQPPFEYHNPFNPEDTSQAPVDASEGLSIDDLLERVEALSVPYKVTKEGLQGFIDSAENQYFDITENTYTKVTGAKGSTVKIQGSLADYTKQLAMLSHRNFELGSTTAVDVFQNNGMYFSVVLKKSKANIKKDLEEVRAKAKVRYRDAIKHDEEKRLVQLKLAKESLQIAINFQNEYQNRISKALENL